MSLLSTICRVFAFVLQLFKAVVRMVSEAAKIVASAAVDVLDTVVSGVSAIVGKSFGKLLPLILIGGAAYLLLKQSEKDKPTVKISSTTPELGGPQLESS